MMEMQFLENKTKKTPLIISSFHYIKTWFIKSEMFSHTLRMRSLNADADFSSHPVNFDF